MIGDDATMSLGRWWIRILGLSNFSSNCRFKLTAQNKVVIRTDRNIQLEGSKLSSWKVIKLYDFQSRSGLITPFNHLQFQIKSSKSKVITPEHHFEPLIANCSHINFGSRIRLTVHTLVHTENAKLSKETSKQTFESNFRSKLSKVSKWLKAH